MTNRTWIGIVSVVHRRRRVHQRRPHQLAFLPSSPLKAARRAPARRDARVPSPLRRPEPGAATGQLAGAAARRRPDHGAVREPRIATCGCRSPRACRIRGPWRFCPTAPSLSPSAQAASASSATASWIRRRFAGVPAVAATRAQRPARHRAASTICGEPLRLPDVPQAGRPAPSARGSRADGRRAGRPGGGRGPAPAIQLSLARGDLGRQGARRRHRHLQHLSAAGSASRIVFGATA